MTQEREGAPQPPSEDTTNILGLRRILGAENPESSQSGDTLEDGFVSSRWDSFARDHIPFGLVSSGAGNRSSESLGMDSHKAVSGGWLPLRDKVLRIPVGRSRLSAGRRKFVRGLDLPFAVVGRA